MRFTSVALAAATILSGADAAYKGFNYGAFFGNNQAKTYDDFKYEFEAAKALPGTNSQFTSARLYTMIQWGTTNSVITAIKAAIDTKTTLLLGIWASSGQTGVNNELAALKSAISTYGTAFTDLVVGISVGSEDLYRITPTAIKNGETNPGAQPKDLVNYISQVRAAIKGTGLASKPIGHVDTWTAYVNGSNSAVVSALDFLGVDAYPYWEVDHANSIGNANATFYDALKQTKDHAQGKPVWVTETGWPVTGPQQNQAVASNANARIYWEDVSCSLMKNNVNLFYYTLQDVQYSTPSPSFGIKPGGDLKAVNPLFDLSCPSSSKAPDVSTATVSSASTVTGTGTVSTDTLSITGIPTVSAPTTATSVLATSSTPTGTSFPGLPVLNQPQGLKPPFVAPNLIVPIDSSDPNKVIGNQFTAQLSLTRSTIFVFNVPPTPGKICNVVFALPPAFDPQWVAPLNINSPGGISVSRLETPATRVTTSSTVAKAQVVGGIPALLPGNKYQVASAPCEAGQMVGYRIDSVGGLDMNFFQMTSPALGLFMEIS